MNELMQYLPFLIPAFIIQVILALTALIHVLRHPHYKFGNKAIWVVVVLIFQFVGPVVYFILGKGEDE